MFGAAGAVSSNARGELVALRYLPGAGGTASGSGGNYSIKQDTEYQLFSSAQSGITVPWGGPDFLGNWSTIVDAVVQASATRRPVTYCLWACVKCSTVNARYGCDACDVSAAD